MTTKSVWSKGGFLVLGRGAQPQSLEWYHLAHRAPQESRNLGKGNSDNINCYSLTATLAALRAAGSTVQASRCQVRHVARLRDRGRQLDQGSMWPAQPCIGSGPQLDQGSGQPDRPHMNESCTTHPACRARRLGTAVVYLDSLTDFHHRFNNYHSSIKFSPEYDYIKINFLDTMK